jgi:sulfonate transport system substrate-binding protein
MTSSNGSGMGRVVRAALTPVVLAVVVTAGLAACGKAAGASGPMTLRLGYFPNLTHATPIVGIEKGIYSKNLGNEVKLDTKTFNAGPSAIEALFSGAVDAVYVGPNPTVNAWSQSKGKAIKVIAGAASGGVAFVVKPQITTPEQLKGKKIATPQLGNTQDVALRYWLKQHNLTATKDGGGDVSVLPQDNSTTVDAFATGAIDGAWVPEPYASRLVKAGGHVLVDERDLWPGGKFVITNLVVRTDFLNAHRDVVKNLVAANVASNKYIAANPADAQQTLSTAIGKLTNGKPLDIKQITDAWPSLTFLDDPLAETLRAGAQHATEIGLLNKVDLSGLYDLSLLNQVLKANGGAQVQS